MKDNEEEKNNLESGSAESEPTTQESKVEESKKEEEKTFTRDEVNKIVNAEKQKERDNVLKELDEKKKEAEKLAQMDEDQKRNYELEEARKRAEEAERKLNERDLEAETLRQAGDRGISLDLIKTIDFEKETAESITKKLDIFEKTTKSERERVINEYSRETPPRTGDKVTTDENLSGYEKFLKNYK